MIELSSALEYLKTAEPILSYSDSTQSWSLEFGMTYGDVFEAPNLAELTVQLIEWLSVELPS